MNNSNHPKDKIRKLLLEQRARLSKSAQQEKSTKISKHIKQSSIFIQSKKIAIYHAVRGEADPAPLKHSTTSEDTNKQFYLPILSPDKTQGLVFAPIDQHTRYKNNTFAIPEPVIHHRAFVKAEELDLVIMPLLGFDLSGNRLGMGGGYYDRSFAFKKDKPEKPVLIGFAYDFQQVEGLIAEPWDIGLDMIATESGLKSSKIKPDI